MRRDPGQRHQPATLAVIVIAMGMLALAPTPAQAAPFSPRLNFAYVLATGYWSQEPEACASIDKQIVPPGSLGDPRIGATSGRSSQVLPDAQPGSVSCILWIDRAYAEPIIFDLLCAVMVHHVGHLLGLEHSPDPRNAMHANIPVPRLCKVKGRQATRLYILRLKFHRLRSRRGAKVERKRRRLLRELRNEAKRFWTPPPRAGA
jgi:hypothetical protein